MKQRVTLKMLERTEVQAEIKFLYYPGIKMNFFGLTFIILWCSVKFQTLPLTKITGYLCTWVGKFCPIANIGRSPYQIWNLAESIGLPESNLADVIDHIIPATVINDRHTMTQGTHHLLYERTPGRVRTYVAQ